jgi:hypothetical protein
MVGLDRDRPRSEGIGSDEDGPGCRGVRDSSREHRATSRRRRRARRFRGDDAAGELMVTGVAMRGPMQRARSPCLEGSRHDIGREARLLWLIDPPAAGPGASSGCSRGEPERASRHAHQAVELIKTVGTVLHMKLVSERDIGSPMAIMARDLRITVHGLVIHLSSPPIWSICTRRI